MVHNSEKYEKAKEFRKRGFTYSEIAKLVGISKSTVSNWFSRETWSESVTQSNRKNAFRENGKRISLLNKARSNQNKKLYTEAERSAGVEFAHYKNNPLFIAGLMLYMTKGDLMHPHVIRFTSANPDTHRIFIKFLKEYMGVSREKIRFWLLLCPSHNALTLSREWSKKIHVPISQHHKYQVIQQKNSKRTLRFGVGNTIIGDTILKKKLIKWLELVNKSLT